MKSIPVILQVAYVLATLAHPSRIVYLCSWGLTLLPPLSNSNYLGYISTLHHCNPSLAEALWARDVRNHMYK